jgi:hypothetical protein
MEKIIKIMRKKYTSKCNERAIGSKGSRCSVDVYDVISEDSASCEISNDEFGQLHRIFQSKK